MYVNELTRRSATLQKDLRKPPRKQRQFRKSLRSLLELITFSVWASFGLMAGTAGVEIENPCPFVEETGEAAIADLQVVIRDLKTRTRGLEMYSQETLSFINSTFPFLDFGRYDYVNFTHPIDNNTTEAAAYNATIDATSALLSHWSLLYKLLTHLHNISNDGVIGQSENDGSYTGTLREKLLEMELRTYSVVCDLKIGLNTLETDTNTPAYEPPNNFFYFSNTFSNEVYRAHIVTRESVMVMTYLNRIYSTMEEAYN